MWLARVFLCVGLSALGRAADHCPASYLRTPAYPQLARMARVMGVVHVRLVVGQSGTPSIVEYQGHKLFSSAINEVVFESTFPSECVGKSLDVRYTFGFDAKVDYENTLVLFDPPNDFVVLIGLPPAMADRVSSPGR